MELSRSLRITSLSSFTKMGRSLCKHSPVHSSHKKKNNRLSEKSYSVVSIPTDILAEVELNSGIYFCYSTTKKSCYLSTQFNILVYRFLISNSQSAAARQFARTGAQGWKAQPEWKETAEVANCCHSIVITLEPIRLGRKKLDSVGNLARQPIDSYTGWISVLLTF